MNEDVEFELMRKDLDRDCELRRRNSNSFACVFEVYLSRVAFTDSVVLI